MNMQVNSQKNGQFIAIGGIGIALIGFFLIPFMTMSMTSINTETRPAQTQTYSSTFSALQAASIQGFIWLDVLLAVGILLVVLLLAFSRNPFDMSRVPLAKQFQRGVYVVIAASIVSLLVQYAVMQSVPGSLISMISSASGNSSNPLQSSLNGLSMSYTTGSWFYVFGMLIAIGGEIYVLWAAKQATVASAVVAPQNMLAEPSTPSPWQQPATYQQPYQYPSQPAQEQYPPQQPYQQPPQPPTEYR